MLYQKIIMKATNRNIPLEELPDSDLIDLVLTFGLFANICKQQDVKCKKFSLKRLLQCSLKLYDMNLIHLCKVKGIYTIQTSQLPATIVQHLISTETGKSFLPHKILFLVDEFLKVEKKNQIFKKLNQAKKTQ